MTQTDARSERLQIRLHPRDRALIEEAAKAKGVTLTEFVVSAARPAARDTLADRTEFVLGPEAACWWEEINARPARDLPSVRALMERPSPCVEE